MSYYLGYRDNDLQYKKINLKGIIDKPTDIYNLIKFTINFTNTDELNDYLLEKKLINKRICPYYLKVKDRVLQPANDFMIYYSSSADYFDTKYLEEYLYENINDIDLFWSIYKNSLKETGSLYLLNLYLKSISDKPVLLIDRLKRCDEIYLNSYLKYNIDKIDKIINEYFTPNKDVYSYREVYENIEYQDCLNNILNELKDIDIATRFYDALRSTMHYNNSYDKRLYALRKFISFLENNDLSNMYIDSERLNNSFNNFYQSFVYKNDNKTINGTTFVLLAKEVIKYQNKKDISVDKAKGL